MPKFFSVSIGSLTVRAALAGRWTIMVEKTEHITELSSDMLDPSITRFLDRAGPDEMLMVTLPSGKIAVVMSGDDFEGYVATSEILSNPQRAEALKRGLAELGNRTATASTGAAPVNDAPLIAALSELGSLLSDPDIPEGVVLATSRLSECQTKLFRTHFHCHRTGQREGGAFFSYSLEPSDFLRELLAAVRAFEWPRVLVLVHDATSHGGV
jgi:PHD/YefM family antitoxin component YafN of YafNO toxin-antitoxin module